MSVVIAGIVNLKTGEVIETVTHPAKKTALRLKVRDELNVEFGKDAFMAFELDLALTNIGYYRRALGNRNTGQLDELYARYQVMHKQRLLDDAKAELLLAKAVYEDVAALFKNDMDKRDHALSYLHDAVNEAEDAESAAKYSLQRAMTYLHGLHVGA